MHATDVIIYVTRQNMNIMGSTFSAFNMLLTCEALERQKKKKKKKKSFGKSK